MQIAAADTETFDPAALYQQATRSLPSYARPLFIRIRLQLEVTGNYKNRKIRFKEEGFDPKGVGDPLYFRDDVAGRYVELDEQLHADILSGRIPGPVAGAREGNP